MQQDEAHVRLRKYYERLCIAVVSGYQRYRKYPNRTVHRRSTRANIVNDEILATVVQEFHDVGEARVLSIPRKNLRFLQVGDGLLLWFKKTDRLRRPRIYPTDNALTLESGRQLRLFPACTILIVGYLLNRDETKVQRVSISKPAGRGKKPEWFIDLEPAEDSKLAVIRNGDSDNSKRFRVVVKRSPVQSKLIES